MKFKLILSNLACLVIILALSACNTTGGNQADSQSIASNVSFKTKILSKNKLLELLNGNTMIATYTKTGVKTYYYHQQDGTLIIETEDGGGRDTSWKVEADGRHCYIRKNGDWSCLPIRQVSNNSYERYKEIMYGDKVILKIHAIEKGNSKDL